ncbi:hypothetical protein CIHG_09982 [Coccidioides immitis H538.4]|uniref:Uncharacterized protein n=1 Tax=Coccidioides immitis H538.4 TaxID=396776 RepID=A0A0J8S7E7_COCIT|nr:hypothetical protein CIHG_09982 [Coccidioides immitis H538.4]
MDGAIPSESNAVMRLRVKSSHGGVSRLWRKGEELNTREQQSGSSPPQEVHINLERQTIGAGDALPLKTSSRKPVGDAFGRRHALRSRSISDVLVWQAPGYFAANVASFSKATRRIYVECLHIGRKHKPEHRKRSGRIRIHIVFNEAQELPSRPTGLGYSILLCLGCLFFNNLSGTEHAVNYGAL